MISVSVKKRNGSFHLDASLKDGGIICLTGPNGSGKSTLLNVISGLARPDEGFVMLDSKDITNLSIEERGVVLVTPQSYIPHLEVKKHLAWGAAAKGATAEEEAVRNVRKKLGIDYEGKMSALSLGMRARVSLATALISKPALILVDETFSSIDNRREFVRAFCELARAASTEVIYTSQQAEEDAKLADHHYTIEQGKTARKY